MRLLPSPPLRLRGSAPGGDLCRCVLHLTSDPRKSGGKKPAMKPRAAVALEKGKPLTITEVELEGPKASEVLVEVKATGICHTDEFTLSGADPEGLFPAILGHEGAGI